MKKLFLLLLTGALLCSLFACGSGSDDNTKKSATGGKGITEFPRQETLYMAGIQWGDPDTFNPLYDWPAWPVERNALNLIYEYLVLYNTLTGKSEPLLGTIHEHTKDYLSVIVNPAARWADGKPVTGEDVKYSFELGKRFKSILKARVWDFIKDITVEKIPDPAGSGQEVEKVTFTVNKEKENNSMELENLMREISILPSHVIEPKLQAVNNDLSAFLKDKMDKNPIGSGPYRLLTYSPEKIVLERRDDYWGNKALYKGRLPKPKYIIHPIYKSNDHFSIAMQKGQLDVNSNFIPRIWLKERHGVRTWYKKPPYFVPATIPMFSINHTRYPLSDKNYRRAMAHAINYKNIRELAMSGYSPPLEPGLILPFGLEKKYFSAEDTEKYGAKYDIEKAKKILADAGYKSIFKDGKLDHMLNAKGERVPTMHIKSPAGWSDWEAMVKIAVNDMRAAGIDVREGICDESMYWQAEPVGDFDLFMNTPEATLTPSFPWSRFQATMAARNWKPEGEKMTENKGRFNNPNSPEYVARVDELLKLIPNLTDEAEKTKAYRELNIIFMQEIPTLPLVYRPEEFYDFSIKHWTNFPTEDNPYAPPQLPCFGVGRNMLWEIEPVKK